MPANDEHPHRPNQAGVAARPSCAYFIPRLEEANSGTDFPGKRGKHSAEGTVLLRVIRVGHQNATTQLYQLYFERLRHLLEQTV
jgi:hypothetical protein